MEAANPFFDSAFASKHSQTGLIAPRPFTSPCVNAQSELWYHTTKLMPESFTATSRSSLSCWCLLCLPCQFLTCPRSPPHTIILGVHNESSPPKPTASLPSLSAYDHALLECI
eukprot:713136-Pelagomonas_calceolata.AAC.2